MAFNFDDLKKRANELAQQAAGLAQVGANKSRQLATVAKLRAANLGEEDTIRKAYAELGKVYFAKYGEHPEDEFAAACETIIEAQAAIAANNATIEELTAKEEAEVEVEIEVVEEEVPAEDAPAEETAAEEAPAEEAAPEEAPAEEAAPEEAAPVEEAEEEAAPAAEEEAPAQAEEETAEE